MRKAINENPMVQIGLLAVLGLAVALLLITRMGGGGGGGETAPPASSTGSESATTEESAAVESSAPATSTGPVVEGPSASIEVSPSGPAQPSLGFVPGKGLPKSIVVAYAQDKAVVLLVMRRGAIDDRAVKDAVQNLRARSDVAVFVTGAGQIARYSRITEGVNVSQVPALVVIQPRSVTDDVPTASVSYGFRGGPSIVQAVEDALYTGGRVPYYPR